MSLHGTHVEANGAIKWGWLGKTMAGIVLSAFVAVTGALVGYVIQSERRAGALELLARETSESLKIHLQIPSHAGAVSRQEFQDALEAIRADAAGHVTREEMTATLSRLHDDIARNRAELSELSAAIGRLETVVIETARKNGTKP